MNATHAHSIRATSSQFASAEAHIPRDSSDGIGLNEAAGAWPVGPVGSYTSACDSHHRAFYPPITFIDKLLINGTNLRAPVAELHPGQARILQSIAELAHFTGGFRVFGTSPLVRVCIQLGSIRDVYNARLHVLQLRKQLIGLVNTMNPTLVSRGGGCKDIEARVRTASDTSAYLEITVIAEITDQSDGFTFDVLLAELAPLMEQLTDGAKSSTTSIDIAYRQLLCAQVTLDPNGFSLAAASGQALAGRIVELHDFTCMARERISERNADVLATANSMLGTTGSASGSTDSGRNTWTAHDDHAVPLATWYRDHQGHLAGRISLPVLTERVGQPGALAASASAQTSATTTVQCTALLSPAIAAIGLAQSLANLHAHAGEAIAQGNPGQHAHDLALLAGARGSEVVHVVRALISARSIRGDLAIATLDKLRGR